jgi:methionyl aminopeptidase
VLQAAKEDSIRVLSPEEIEKMKVSCKLGREVLDEAAKVIKAGTTTDEIDKVVHDASVARNCYPSPLNYREFPKSVCTSVNEVICHGIPDGYPLKDGDIVNVDVTVYFNGHVPCSLARSLSHARSLCFVFKGCESDPMNACCVLQWCSQCCVQSVG